MNWTEYDFIFFVKNINIINVINKTLMGRLDCLIYFKKKHSKLNEPIGISVWGEMLFVSELFLSTLAIISGRWDMEVQIINYLHLN